MIDVVRCADGAGDDGKPYCEKIGVRVVVELMMEWFLCSYVHACQSCDRRSRVHGHRGATGSGENGRKLAGMSE